MSLKELELREGEVAKWVPSYENSYSVTNRGRVFSFHKRHRTPYEMMPKSDAHGHLRLELSKNGEIEHWFVHRLVLTAFRRPAREGEVSRHLDGCPTNNNIENLKWGTHIENMSDTIRHGSQKGENNGSATLSKDNVLEIRRLWDSKDCKNQCELARMFNTSNSNIHLIVHRKSWTGVEPE